MWTYSQSTGQLLNPNGAYVATGYSGFADAKNDSNREQDKNLGPIPRGQWQMIEKFDSASHGPFCIRLWPSSDTDCFNRDGFLVHGDSIKNPGTASHGCIILPRTIREMLWKSADKWIDVV